MSTLDPKLEQAMLRRKSQAQEGQSFEWSSKNVPVATLQIDPHNLPQIDEGGYDRSAGVAASTGSAADMYKSYAQDAKSQGRSSGAGDDVTTLHDCEGRCRSITAERDEARIDLQTVKKELSLLKELNRGTKEEAKAAKTLVKSAQDASKEAERALEEAEEAKLKAKKESETAERTKKNFEKKMKVLSFWNKKTKKKSRRLHNLETLTSLTNLSGNR